MAASRSKIFAARSAVKASDLIFSSLPSRLKLIFLRSIARSLGINMIGASGSCGQIVGSPDDIIVLGRYIREKAYSPGLIALLKKYVGSGTYVDIGANIGLTTIPIAASGRFCISFEPDPTCFEYLRRNVAENGCADRVQLHQLALFDRDSELEFRHSAWNFGDNRIADTSVEPSVYHENTWDTVTVKACRIDDVVDVSTLQRPLVAKMDIQGAEVGALAGGEKFFRSLDSLQFEFWPYGIKRLGADPNKLVEFILGTFSRGLIFNDSHADRSDQPLSDLGAVADAMRHHIERGTISHIDVFVTK